jgi:hypothetical protein
LLLLALAGCEKNEPKPESTRQDADAGLSKVEAIDPNLAEAVAAASAAPGRGAPRPQVEGAPPPDGVFAPGAADKELTRGAVPKITLGSEGADPKVQLGPTKAASKLSGTIQVAVQSDPRQGALPILLGITLEPKKVEAKAGDKPAAQLVSARITSAKVDTTGIPKELDEQLGRLKGSKVEYSILPNGAASGMRIEVTKGAPDDIVHSLSDALGLLTIPYPDKPIGAGGYFMVTSRDELMGLDLVTYRMIKVKEVTADGVTLDVNTKRYSASRTLDLPGMPPDIDKTLVQFEAASEGTVRVAPGALLPAKGEINSVLAAVFAAADPKRRPSIQLQTRTQLDLK